MNYFWNVYCFLKGDGKQWIVNFNTKIRISYLCSTIQKLWNIKGFLESAF